MARRGVGRAALAACLSALFPGLGQLYNREWGKGLGFVSAVLVLGGLLVTSIDPNALQAGLAAGQPPPNLGRLFLLWATLLAVALWSIIDAARLANRARPTDRI
ncbi:MAG: hypothetical protein ACREI3_01205 [Nitrospirales bacterium]